MRSSALLAAAVASALVLAGCTTVHHAGPRCPESVETCLTAADCAEDAARGCTLCACRAWNDLRPRSGAGVAAVPVETRGPPPPARP
ncbi:MAG TPA: hypothetical protein VF875_05905 [Anaeromyxobacter sp.]